MMGYRESSAFALVVNLSNAAHWHATHCQAECDVSLSLLRELAQVVTDEFLGGEDAKKADIMISAMPLVLENPSGPLKGVT